MIFRLGNIYYIFFQLLLSIFIFSCQNTEVILEQNKSYLASSCSIPPPTDTVMLESGLSDFLLILDKTIQERQLDSLVNLLDSNVIVSYGEALSGKAAFVNYWKDSLNQIKLWNILNQLYLIGGSIEYRASKSIYTFPYTHIDSLYTKNPIDCFELAVIVKPLVKFYDSSFQREIGVLKYDVVQVLDWSNPVYTKIKSLCSNKVGWVLNESLYACSDYSLTIWRTTLNEWKIGVFSNG